MDCRKSDSVGKLTLRDGKLETISNAKPYYIEPKE